MRRRAFLTGASIAAGQILPGIGLAATRTDEATVARALARSMVWAADVRGAGAPSARDGISDAFVNRAAELPDLHVGFRRDVTLATVPAAATLHLFAYTRYRLYLNGRYVARGPARFDNARPEYDSHDVARFLRPGRNTIAVLVHRDSPGGRMMAHDPGLAALLTWQGDRGGERSLATGPDWRAREDRSFGRREASWSSISETIDARLTEDWTGAAHDASAWPRAVAVGGTGFAPLMPRSIPLLRETVVPSRTERGPLPIVLAAGQRVSVALDRIALAYVRLEIDATEGAAFTCTFRMIDDSVTGQNRYTARAGRQTYESGDVYAASTMEIAVGQGRVTLHDVAMIEVVYPLDILGRFASSDPELDAIWAMCARSLPLISEDAYTDCADRERVEWTDCTPPAYQATRVMAAGPDGHWSDGRLQRALLRRIALTQTPDGRMKAHSCSERWDIHGVMDDRSCDWVNSLREYFDASGDAAFVRSVWPGLGRLLTWFLSRRTARGLVNATEWVTWDNPLRYQSGEGTALNALVCLALRDAAYLASAIGQPQQAHAWGAAADALAAAINGLLWDETAGSYSGGLFPRGWAPARQMGTPPFAEPSTVVDGRYPPTFHAALFALYAGLVPPGRRERAERWLLAHREDARGPMSRHYLFHLLYALNRPEHDATALAMMKQGWKAMAVVPGGLSWEALEGGGSRAHVYGIVPAWILGSYVLGVRLDGPASRRRLMIDPRSAGLSHAEGVVVTELGPVPIAWHRAQDDRLSIEGEVPHGAVATLVLGKGYATLNGQHVTGPSVEAGPGRFRLACTMFARPADQLPRL